MPRRSDRRFVVTPATQYPAATAAARCPVAHPWCSPSVTATPVAAFTLGRSRIRLLDTAGGRFAAPNDVLGRATYLGRPSLSRPAAARPGPSGSAHDDSAPYRPAGSRRVREPTLGDRANERDVPLVSCLDRDTGASRPRGARRCERPYSRVPDHRPCPSDRCGHRWWCSNWLSRAAWRIW
jgi:hypothetical protein